MIGNMLGGNNPWGRKYWQPQGIIPTAGIGAATYGGVPSTRIDTTGAPTAGGMSSEGGPAETSIQNRLRYLMGLGGPQANLGVMP
jgi:hypothetical protein